MSEPSAIQDLELDRTIHERSRLMILTRLSSTESASADFTALKTALGFTQGNLSVHLKNLEAANYVEIEKSFVGNKPNTLVKLTETGRLALMKYLSEMESLIRAFKK